MARKSPQQIEEEKERQRAQAQRQIEEEKKMLREDRRALCTALLFATVCAEPCCRRARRCVGDVDKCFTLFWPHVPERLKNKVRKAIEFRNEGLSPRAAARAAIEFVNERERKVAELERQALARREDARAAGHAEGESPLPPITRCEPRFAPRIRRL